MNKNVLGIVLGVIVIIVAALLFSNNNTNSDVADDNDQLTTQPTATSTPSESPTPTGNPSLTPTPSDTQNTTPPKIVEVSMTDTGYTPAAITINKGDTVRFVNNGTKAIWPASAPHPTHTDYPEFDPKKGIEPGASWTFKFDRTGRWPYHDHLNPTRFGSVTVQ